MVDPRVQALQLRALLNDSSIEITARDVELLEKAAPAIAAGSMISITFLPGETFASRVDAAARVGALGFRPVPHISARRLSSAGELEGFLDALASRIALDHVFVVAGDLPQPAGPYGDALSIIHSGLFVRYGVSHVGVAGYPEGHPQIASDLLWQALADKSAALEAQGIAWSIMTQFAFDAVPVAHWLSELRERGIKVPVRCGVPGPASVKTLLRFAARCGVGTSARVMAKYGLSLGRLLNTAGPDGFIEELAASLPAGSDATTALHLYPFGGLNRTAEWLGEFRARSA